MKKAAAVVSVALAVTLSACGGDDKKSATPVTSTAAPATTAGTYTGDRNSRFCQLGADFSQRFNRLNTSLTGGPDRARTEMTSLKGVIEDARQAAPPAIKGDVEKLAGAFDQFFSQVEAANFDPQAISGAASKLVNPDVQMAAQHLQAYGQQVCGLETNPGTP